MIISQFYQIKREICVKSCEVSLAEKLLQFTKNQDFAECV